MDEENNKKLRLWLALSNLYPSIEVDFDYWGNLPLGGVL